VAKLTRTQKFAELRENLANDKESSLTTNDLSNYKDRLDNITEQLSTSDKKIEEASLENNPNYSWVDFKEPDFSDPLQDLDKVVEDIRKETFVWNDLQEVPPAKKKESAAEPVKENEPVKDVQAVPVTEEKSESPYMGYYQYQPNPEIEAAYAQAEKNASEAEKLIKEVQEKATQDDLSTDIDISVEDILKDVYAKEEKADNHPIEHPENTNNTYLNDTFSEVGKYNLENGEQTIDQVTSSMVNEIRHPEEEVIDVPVAQETIVNQPVINEIPASEPVANEENEDEEFSNSISMEISKIIEEANEIEDREEEKPVLEAIEEVHEEHPVLAKVLEGEETEDVVEIKNLKELEAEPVREATSSTIPFVVSTNDEEDIIDDDEEEGSNTILNVILIVLILILVAVLGMIVFYILKTKGII